jgi:1-deoxy-D-xylulose-5-phosphate synthase
VHVVTRKGAGYEPAERTPELFHGVGPFDAATGEVEQPVATEPTFTDVFGTTLLHEARVDDRIVAITAGMEGGTGLTSFAREFPRRFVDVGISEEHAVGLASGIAAGGGKPVVAIYSTFLQRGIDQVIVDMALAGQDMVLCVDRSGLVGEDGATHQGAFDLSYLRMIPNLRLLAPSDGLELESALRTALAMGGPFAIRYPKGPCPVLRQGTESEVLEPGASRTLREGDDVAILALGSMVAPALGAAELLAEEGISARVVDLRWVKPLDAEAVRAASKVDKRIATDSCRYSHNKPLRTVTVQFKYK